MYSIKGLLSSILSELRLMNGTGAGHPPRPDVPTPPPPPPPLPTRGLPRPNKTPLAEPPPRPTAVQNSLMPDSSVGEAMNTLNKLSSTLADAAMHPLSYQQHADAQANIAAIKRTLLEITKTGREVRMTCCQGRGKLSDGTAGRWDSFGCACLLLEVSTRPPLSLKPAPA